MSLLMKALQTGLVGLAVASAPLHASKSPASTRLSVAQAQGTNNPDVLTLPVCSDDVTTYCRKIEKRGGGLVWVAVGVAALAGAIFAASPGGGPSSP